MGAEGKSEMKTSKYERKCTIFVLPAPFGTGVNVPFGVGVTPIFGTFGHTPRKSLMLQEVSVAVIHIYYVE